MNNIVTKGILLGLGILSASTFVAAPASAAPHDRVIVERQTIIRHPGGGFRPGRPDRSRSIRGVVTRDLSGNDFNLRVNGRIVRVIVPSGEPRRLSKGDVVEAYGRYEGGGNFRARSATVIRNR